ncbi:MAG: cytochrome b/b6 domain-containing protein [Paracoccaceae bacterium]
MSLNNTPAQYGSVAKTLHWLTVILIFILFPMGLIAHELPYETSEQLAFKATLFSAHKTIGMAALMVAILRILWALTQKQPKPLHPERRAETLLAHTAHWALYIAIIAVPLTGFLHHAATTGFAPINWPFGQSLPFIPQSDKLATAFGGMHQSFNFVLMITVGLHIAGALKHAIIDKDSTLKRMLPRQTAETPPASAHKSPAKPAALALLAFAAATAFALLTRPEQAQPIAPRALAPTTSEWTVTEGTIAIEVLQMGAQVSGSFSNWAANISFDPETAAETKGQIDVEIDIASLTLGSVSAQALTPEYFDATTFPTATFSAPILQTDTGYTAPGTLTLKGITIPATLPFTLQLEDNTAKATGQLTLNRQSFNIGTKTDEQTLGFDVPVTITLTATRD